MRIPAQYRTWWTYAGMAYLTALCFYSLAIIAIPNQGKTFSLETNVFWALVYSLSVIPAALVAWPKRVSRTGIQMAMVGISTVCLGFMFLGFAYAMPSISQDGIGEGLLAMLIDGLFFLLLGSLATFGIPHVLWAMISLLFRDDPT